MIAIETVIPSVDRLLRSKDAEPLINDHGRTVVTEAIRYVLAQLRKELATPRETELLKMDYTTIMEQVLERIEEISRATMVPVFNLTGTILHTNLGRAPLPEEAVEAMVEVATGATNVEFDLATGRRGDRDDHIESLVCELTGAEAATVVNNNAAAVLLVLNTLAKDKKVAVSRGELIEIGGAFRVPEIMSRAGAKLCEVGTTNRTHLKDFREAMTPGMGLVMKVHTSNYRIEGFTAEVPERDLAKLCREHDVPSVVDLGSGTVIDFTRFGLPYEPTVADTLSQGVDIVTFSGDKLLGGPQAGLICGRADLIREIKRNPMKRAMRLDKVTLAALAAVLRLYRDPDRLTQRIPTLRLLSRSSEDIRSLAERLLEPVTTSLGILATVDIIECQSQIGSGSLPSERLLSYALAIRPHTRKRGSGKALDQLAKVFRELPRPVIGRIHDGALKLDLRCLEDEAAFVGQLAEMALEQQGSEQQ